MSLQPFDTFTLRQAQGRGFDFTPSKPDRARPRNDRGPLRSTEAGIARPRDLRRAGISRKSVAPAGPAVTADRQLEACGSWPARAADLAPAPPRAGRRY